jgi:hypothetical protein
MARTLNGQCQLALMPRAGAGYPAGDYLCALAEISSQAGHILIVDIVDFIYAKGAYLFPALAVAARALGALASIAVSVSAFHEFASFHFPNTG